jgi:hypothetical protein
MHALIKSPDNFTGFIYDECARLSINLPTKNGIPYPLLLDRPEGDVFYWLGHKVQNSLSNRNRKKRLSSLAALNFTKSLLLVAAKERVFSSEQIRLINGVYASHKVEAEFYWAVLQLFKAVATLADELGAEIPHELRDHRKAWANWFMDCVYQSLESWESDPITMEWRHSKKSFTKGLRDDVKDLKAQVIPPGLKLDALLQHAWMLSSHSTADNKGTNLFRSSKKAVRNALKGLEASLTALATDFDRNTAIKLKS